MDLETTVMVLGNRLAQDQWVTTQHAAQVSGYSEEYIRRLVRKGRLTHKPAAKARTYLIKLDDLLRHRSESDSSGNARHIPHIWRAEGNKPDTSDSARARDLDLITPDADTISTSTFAEFEPPKIIPARYILTDQLALLTEIPPGPVVRNETSAKQVRQLLSHPDMKPGRIGHYFSSKAVAGAIGSQLGMAFADIGRKPQLLPGDNLIFISTSSELGTSLVTLAFSLFRLVI
jgi:hypothetical protein